MINKIIKIISSITIEVLGSVYFILILIEEYLHTVNYQRNIFVMIGMIFFLLADIKKKIPKKIKIMGNVDIKTDKVNFNSSSNDKTETIL